MKEITIEIDGRRVTVPEGVTVFEAALKLGIEIPHLCYHPSLPFLGACRLCVVEIEGARGLPASCVTPVAAGMVVRTNTERVREARRTILDLLLANHPLDCLTCEKAGECRLQHYAYEYGVASSTWQGERKRLEPDESNPFFVRDQEKCILCGRCVRMCQDVQGRHAIDYVHRGFAVRVSTPYDVSLTETSCVFCGNCVTVCPVGALTPKMSRGRGRTWEYTKVRTVCPYCGVGCNVYLHVKDGRVIGASAAEGPAHEGLLCVKGHFGYEFIHRPDRLRVPLIRQGKSFREASWEEALSLVAGRLLETRKRYGASAVAALASAKCTNEENYLLQKVFRAVLGTNNVDHCARLCHASTVVGLAAAFGSGAMTNSIREIAEAELLLVTGSNTTETHPVIGTRIIRAKRAGARLIVADPRRIALAEEADLFLQLLPGSNVALFNGLAHVIVKEKLYDAQFIAERTEGFAELVEALEPYTPEYVEGITGVPAELIVRAARMYATARRAMILYSMGITQHTSGTDNVLAIANLAMLCGHVGREGTGVNPLRGQNNVQGACDLGALPNVLPGYQRVDDAEVRRKFEECWGAPVPTQPGLTVVEMMEAAARGQLRALYIMGENPMLSDPDINHVREALEKVEFLVVQDIFMTETACLADVVLPGACFAEKDGTFTNTERRVQRVHKAVDPPGEALPDWVILCRLAQKMGYPMSYDHPREILEEIRRLTPIYGGISWERLGTDGLQWPCRDADDPGTPYLHKDRFARGKGKFHPVKYRPPAELADEEYPLLLTTGRLLYQFHTGSMSRRSQGLEAMAPEPYIEINPRTAEVLGIGDGQLVEVASRRGSITLRARLTERVARQVVFVPFHYAEAAANVLTNSALDPRAKIPELKVCAVRVRPLGANGSDGGGS